jgi:HEAT repeat protein
MRKTGRGVWPTVAMGLLIGSSAATVSAQEAGIGRTVYGEAEAAYAAAAVARESFYPQDPADSLYRAARDQLSRDRYLQAAELFYQVYQRYPRSSYAAQSLYYQAFALYRSGRERDLRQARDALRELEQNYASSEVALREAEALQARISGELARRGDVEAAERVTRAAAVGVRERTAAQACASEEDEIRMAALNALLQMNSERAIPILKRVLQERDEDNECIVEMRSKAVFLLAQHLDEDNVDVLLDVVQNDPNPEVRGQAVFWLSQVPGERTVDALEGILIESDNPQLQEKALFALSQSGGERASQVLRDYALREDIAPELRGKAIFWLGQRSDNSAFLRDVYARTTDPEVKERIIHSLAMSGGRENGAFLLTIAGDERQSIETRKQAMFWASQAGVSVVEMAGLYERMPERELKEQIIFALAQQGEDAAVDKLLEIARKEKDSELRKKAIFWLSQSDDPRVAEFLLEIIEGGQ